MFPVYVYEKGKELPNDGFYYVIAKNGAFVHKETDMCSMFVPAPRFEEEKMQELDARITFKFPKLPFAIFWQALYFFRKVWDTHKGEAEVNIYYHPGTREYALCCHEQEVSGGGVHYGKEDLSDAAQREALQKFRKDSGEWGNSKGYRKVGSIHSHCNFSAFHSATDIHDEEDFDGVHITLGHVDCEAISISASLVANATRFKVNPDDVIANIQETEESEGWFAKKSERWIPDLTPEQVSEIEAKISPEVLNEWMPKVKKYSYHFFRGWGSDYPTHTQTGWQVSESDYQHDEDHRGKNKTQFTPTLPIDFGYGTPNTEIRYYPRKILKKVKRAAKFLTPLQSRTDNLEGEMAERVDAALLILKKFFRKDHIADEDIELASKIDMEKGLVDEEA